MKRISIIILLSMSPIIVFAQPAERSSEVSLSGSVSLYVPGDDESYDNGVGAEAQIQFWHKNNFGIALAAGAASWEIKEETLFLSENGIDIGVSLDGSVVQLPFGGSILYRTTIGERIRLVFEGGIRYVIVEEDVDDEVLAVDSFGNFVAFSDALEIDDGVVGILAANIELDVSPGVSLFGGAGYQFDIVKGDLIYFGETIGENELEAFFVRAGLLFKL